MKNILLAKEMPLYFKNTIILNKEFRMRNSLFNMDFCSRIIKHYLEFSGYDELFANMVFLDMYKNGSNSVAVIHDKEVYYRTAMEKNYVVKTIFAPLWSVLNECHWHLATPQAKLFVPIMRQEQQMRTNAVIGFYKKSIILQNRMINSLFAKENEISNRISGKIWNREWIQKSDEKTLEKGVLGNREVSRYLTISWESILKKQVVNQETEKGKLYQKDTINSVTKEKPYKKQLDFISGGKLSKRQPDSVPEKQQLFPTAAVNLAIEKNKYHDEGINCVIDYKKMYRGTPIKYENATYVEELDAVHWYRWINTIKRKRKNIRQLRRINYITKQESLYQNMQSRCISCIMENFFDFPMVQKHYCTVAEKNYVAKATHLRRRVSQEKLFVPIMRHKNQMQVNGIIGFYKKSIILQNRVINSLLAKENEISNKISDKIWNREWIQKANENTRGRTALEDRRVFWYLTIPLKNIFAKQALDSAEEKGKFYLKDTINVVTKEELYKQPNFTTREKFSKQQPDSVLKKQQFFQTAAVNFVIEKSQYQDKGINHVTGYTQLYHSAPIKYRNTAYIAEQRIAYGDNPITYIENQNSLHQNMQSRLTFCIIGKSFEIPIIQKHYRTGEEKNYVVKTIFVPIMRQEKQMRTNAVIGFYKKSIILQNQMISSLLAKENEISNKILDKIWNRAWIQKADGNTQDKVIPERREVFRNLTLLFKNIFAKQVVNLAEEKPKLYQKDTINVVAKEELYKQQDFITGEKFSKQQPDSVPKKQQLFSTSAVSLVTEKSQYQDKGINHVTDYTQLYHSASIKYRNTAYIAEQRIAHGDSPITYIENQNSPHQNMQKYSVKMQTQMYYVTKATYLRRRVSLYETLCSVMRQKNQMHVNAAIGFYKKSIILQNQMINNLLAKENEISNKISDKIWNKEWIQKEDENTRSRTAPEDKIVLWQLTIPLKSVFTKQALNLLTEKGKLYQKDTINVVTKEELYKQQDFITGERFSKQQPDSVLKQQQFFPTAAVSRVTEKNQYQDKGINHVTDYTKLYHSAPIKYRNVTCIEGQGIAHGDSPITYIENQNSLHQDMQSRLTFCIIGNFFEIPIIRKHSEKIRTQMQMYYVAKATQMCQKNRMQANAISTIFLKGIYKNNDIISVQNKEFDFWKISQTVLKAAAKLEQIIEKEDDYPRDRVHARKSNISDKIISKVQYQIGDTIEKLQEDLKGERQKSADREKILKVLEMKVQQQEKQIEELKVLCKEIHRQKEEEKSNQMQKEKYLEVFNNDWKLERMRYGVL